MTIAEKLYNEGYISYPRTETDRFDKNFNFKNLLEAQTSDARWGNMCEKLLSEGIKPPRQGANDDKAHPPIHPLKAGGQLTGQEKMIYEFITRRFIACCSDDARGEETSVKAVCNGETFVGYGSILLEANYLDVYHYDKWPGGDIPKFSVGEIITDWKVQIKQGATTAPKLLSESELIGCMDKNGIGTDATIHEHIKKIIERTYVIKNKEGRFHPTGLGVGLVAGFDSVLRSNSLTKPRLRAELERDLSDICKQIKEKSSVRQKFLRQFQQIYFDAKNRITELASEISKQVGDGLLSPAPLESNSYSSDRKRVARSHLERSQSPHDSHSDSDGGGESACPNCHVPVKSKKVTKDGVNKGRKFLSCDLCNFFAWDQQPNSIRVADIGRCKCGLTPVYGVTKGGANKNRGYYKCSRVVNGCGYFQFCDHEKGITNKAKSTTKKPFKRRK